MPIDMKELHVPDDSFWAAGTRSKDPVVRQHGRSYFGVIVDAPWVVNLTARSTLPVFIYYMGEYKQVVTRSFSEHGILAVMDVDQNKLRVCRSSKAAGTDEEPDPDFQVPRDDSPIMEGHSAEIETIDLRERLHLPWKPTTLMLQAILLDLASPRVTTRLVAGGSQFEDPEVRAFLERERAEKDPPAVVRGASALAYPTFRRMASSPELPAEGGIALNVERVVAVDDRKPVLLHGAFRVPLAPEDLVKPAHKEYNAAHGLIADDGLPFAAVAQIHLLTIGSADGDLNVYTLAAPVSSVTAGEKGPVGSGYFTIDLRTVPGLPFTDQTVFFYAFSRDQATGPAVMGVVDRREK
jgi:hypothetical protein